MNDNRYSPPAAPVRDIEDAPTPERPRNVTLGARLLWGQILIGLPGFFYGLFHLPPEVSTGIARIAFLVTMVFTLGFVALTAWFTWMAFMGRHWARVVQLVLMLLGLLFGLWVVKSLFDRSVYNGVIYIVQTVMNVAGVVMLFTPAANAWYRAKRAR